MKSGQTPDKRIHFWKSVLDRGSGAELRCSLCILIWVQSVLERHIAPGWIMAKYRQLWIWLVLQKNSSLFFLKLIYENVCISNAANRVPVCCSFSSKVHCVVFTTNQLLRALVHQDKVLSFFLNTTASPDPCTPLPDANAAHRRQSREHLRSMPPN